MKIGEPIIAVIEPIGISIGEIIVRETKSDTIIKIAPIKIDVGITIRLS